ncbi:MAG: YkgJ family cysteine cluster protein [Acidimicrobiales bacterium]
MADRYSDGPHGTVCNGCGQCCDPVSFPFSQADVVKMGPGQIDARTRRWVLHELTPVPRRQAAAEMPWLTGATMTLPVIDGQYQAGYSSYYRCVHFDRDTRRCGAHADRPPVCRGYPYYGAGRLQPGIKLPYGCSFRADIGQPVDTEWVPVTMRGKP